MSAHAAPTPMSARKLLRNTSRSPERVRNTPANLRPPRAPTAPPPTLGSGKSVAKCRTFRYVPHIGKLPPPRRHFPRYCDVSTRIRHPYRTRFRRSRPVLLRTCGKNGRPPRLHTAEKRILAEPERTPPHGRRSPVPYRGSRARTYPGIPENYQLAFVTPGIRPFEAISRNWIRLMPNSRM